MDQNQERQDGQTFDEQVPEHRETDNVSVEPQSVVSADSEPAPDVAPEPVTDYHSLPEVITAHTADDPSDVADAPVEVAEVSEPISVAEPEPTVEPVTVVEPDVIQEPVAEPEPVTEPPVELKLEQEAVAQPAEDLVLDVATEPDVEPADVPVSADAEQEQQPAETVAFVTDSVEDVPELPDNPDVADASATQVLAPPPDAIDTEADYSPFRQPVEPTSILPVDSDDTTQLTQAELLAQERAERKAARDKALGNVERTPEPEPTPLPVVPTTDKAFASLGLFLFRLVLAGIFGIRGIQHFTNLQATSDVIATTWIPEPSIMAIVLSAAELAIAVSLLIGLLTRVSGFGVAAIAILALVFVLWGQTNPFADATFGFSGEYELVLAGAGLLLLCVGGGGWSIDRRIRRNWQRRKMTGDH